MKMLGRESDRTMTKQKVKAFLRDMLPGGALSLAGCFLLLLYAPLELFFTNLEEFKFGFGPLFPVLLELFLIGLVGCMLLLVFCRLLYQRLYDVVLCGGFVVFLCSYIQGMFFSGSLPALDGEPIRWHEYGVQNLESLILWFVVGVAVVLLARNLHRKRIMTLMGGLSLFFTAILLVTGISVGVMNRGFQERPITVMTTQGQFTMSTDENLVILVVDATDGQTFQNMLETTDPQFAQMLEDFTFYPNTEGAYPFTKFAIPYILHGQWYENQEDYYSFTNRAMENSPLLERLRAEGYRMGFYEGDADYVGGNTVDGVENTKDFTFEIGNRRRLMKEFLKLTWFKYAPWPLKRIVRVDMDDFSQVLAYPDGVEPYRWKNPYVYQSIQEQPLETVPEKCFRFFHTEGAHVPFRYDKDVQLVKDGTYEGNMQCTMTILSSYLEKLKEAGVYDNTAIVILADHGYDNFRDTPLLGRMNPFLAVKGRGESHPMEISEAPVSYEDLQEMYGRLLDGKTGQQVPLCQPGDSRQRRVLFYHYLYEPYIAEYLQTGHAWDTGSFVATGKEYKR